MISRDKKDIKNHTDVAVGRSIDAPMGRDLKFQSVRGLACLKWHLWKRFSIGTRARVRATEKMRDGLRKEMREK